MSDWKDRKKRIRLSFDERALHYIPMVSNHEEKDIYSKIKKEFDDLSLKNIVVIDPYLSPIDLNFIIKCFASTIGRNITVYTRLEYPGDADADFDQNEGDTEKKRILNCFEKNIAELIELNVFNSIVVRVPKVTFHDRYILSIDEFDNNILLSLGSSINSIGRGYSNILNIRNKFFRRQLMSLIQILENKSNGV